MKNVFALALLGVFASTVFWRVAQPLNSQSYRNDGCPVLRALCEGRVPDCQE